MKGCLGTCSSGKIELPVAQRRVRVLAASPRHGLLFFYCLPKSNHNLTVLRREFRLTINLKTNWFWYSVRGKAVKTLSELSLLFYLRLCYALLINKSPFYKHMRPLGHICKIIPSLPSYADLIPILNLTQNLNSYRRSPHEKLTNIYFPFSILKSSIRIRDENA